MKIMKSLATVSLIYLITASSAFAGSYKEESDDFTGKKAVSYEMSEGGLDGMIVRLSEYDVSDGTILFSIQAKGPGMKEAGVALKAADGTIHELATEVVTGEGEFVRIPADWVKDRITLRAKVYSPNLLGLWKWRDRVIELDTSDLDLSRIAKQQP